MYASLGTHSRCPVSICPLTSPSNHNPNLLHKTDLSSVLISIFVLALILVLFCPCLLPSFPSSNGVPGKAQCGMPFSSLFKWHPKAVDLQHMCRDSAHWLASKAHFIHLQASACLQVGNVPPGRIYTYTLSSWQQVLNHSLSYTGHISRGMFLVKPLQTFEFVSFYISTPLAFIFTYYWGIEKQTI